MGKREREKERRHLLNSLTSTQMNIQLLYRRKERKKEGEKKRERIKRRDRQYFVFMYE